MHLMCRGSQYTKGRNPNQIDMGYAQAIVGMELIVGMDLRTKSWKPCTVRAERRRRLTSGVLLTCNYLVPTTTSTSEITLVAHSYDRESQWIEHESASRLGAPTVEWNLLVSSF
mmetsp:Transcript_18081/g.26736  ORF Transcript_18081/g.26736 Transcript_18081/m.26736 type:complete len:114 (+) Transcript_18081:251-592(+)